MKVDHIFVTCEIHPMRDVVYNHYIKCHIQQQKTCVT